MAEQEETDTQHQQGLQGATPLLVSVAAGAAAGALAVVARKALSGGADEESRTDEGGEGATAFDDLEGLVAELRAASEGDKDFKRLVELADTISEYADQAANAFAAAASSDGDEEEGAGRVTDDLMQRIGELTSGKQEPEAGSRREAEREKASR